MWCETCYFSAYWLSDLFDLSGISKVESSTEVLESCSVCGWNGGSSKSFFLTSYLEHDTFQWRGSITGVSTSNPPYDLVNRYHGSWYVFLKWYWSLGRWTESNEARPAARKYGKRSRAAHDPEFRQQYPSEGELRAFPLSFFRNDRVTANCLNFSCRL